MKKYDYTPSKNGLTKKIQDAIIRLDFKLTNDELFGTVSQDIQWLTQALVNDSIIMKANNSITLLERQELAAKSLYANLMNYFATNDEYKNQAKAHDKLKQLAKSIF